MKEPYRKKNNPDTSSFEN